MIKILFLINSLGGGGAEKVLVNLVNNMDREKFDITVETMFGGGVNLKLLLPNIRYIENHFPCPPGIAYIMRLISPRWLYRYFIGDRKYDILVAYMHGAPVKVISGCQDKNVKKIAWLHNGKPKTGSFFRFWFTEKKAFEVYEKCNAIVGVAQSVADAFQSYTHTSKKIDVVYNTNDVEMIRKLSQRDVEKTFSDHDSLKICSVGRLGHEKGFDRLISVVNKLNREGYRCELLIVGAGSKEQELKKQVSDLRAESWINLVGFQNNPYPYVINADLFVCSSREEGLSTAVTEAIILGIPALSTDVSGAKEILGENNEYGLVVENNEESIYTCIKSLILNRELLLTYKKKAQERASFFETQNCVRQAETLFEKVFSEIEETI